MKRILFPTDFSKSANTAFQYAIDLAHHFDAEILMLHVFEAPVIDSNMSAEMLGQEKEGQKQASLQTMRQQVQESGKRVKVDYMAEAGDVVQVIEKIAADRKIDYVVMGTRGGSLTADQVMGSITSEVIYCLQCPVLAIPENAVFQPIQKIVFAVDFEDYDKNTLTQLRHFASSFEAELVLLHVNPEAGYFEPEHIKNYRQMAEQLLDYQNMHFEFFGDEDIMDTINWYMQEKGGDVLAILSHRKETIHKVYEQSYTKKFVLHTDIPLLVFHE